MGQTIRDLGSTIKEAKANQLLEASAAEYQDDFEDSQQDQQMSGFAGEGFEENS